MRQAVCNQTAGRNSGQNEAPSFNGFPQFPQNMVYPPYFLHLTCFFIVTYPACFANTEKNIVCVKCSLALFLFSVIP